MALISLNNLERFFNNLKTYISNALNSKVDSNNLKTINNNSLVGTGNITITASSVDWDNVNNKPSTFTPSIHTHAASDITSGLATVATSGSYNDLSNKPTIPTVNNAILTIQKNGTDVKTFTANASSNVTCNITVPTKTSELANDSGFLTSVLPIGSYIQFAGSQAPAGFLVCNGGEISRTTYSALFAVIGTTYGSGDGSTTFNLPNLTDRFLQGSSTSGTVKNAGLPNITGDTDGCYHVSGDAPDTSWSGAIETSVIRNWYVSPNANDGSITRGTAKHVFNASQSNSIYGNSTTVQPPALTCLICIKY